MSYLVLARKWRPQNFEDVVGQKPITQALQNAIATKRVAHAYLFAGPRGVGKTSVARILAKALNCQEGPTGHPCGRCPFCQEIRDGISVDVLEIDGASNRGIDEIRELRENVKYLPSKNKYKVYIIDEVHMLTDQAFNALLKTLEEPPPHVIFIFATTEAHKIPLTILSRCQRYDFKRIPLALMLGQLKKIAGEEGVEISEASLHLITREAQGSMRDAQSLLDQVLSFSGPKASDAQVIEVLGVINRSALHDTLRALAEGDAVRLLRIVEEVHNFGYDLKEFCGDLAQLTRDLLVVKISPSAPGTAGLVDLPEEEVKELSARAEHFSREEIHGLFRSLIAAHDEVARSTFPRLVLEMTLTRVAREKPVLSVEEVVERLRAMEDRLARAPGPVCPEGSVHAESRPASHETSSSPAEGDELEETRERYLPGGGEKESVPPVSSLETGGGWDDFIGFARKKKPPFASLLEHGIPLVLNDDALEIGYAEKSFYLERMQEADNLAFLRELAQEFYRKKIKVKISRLDPAAVPRGKGVENKEAAKDSERERQEEVLNHPLVREAINILGGRVVDIKLL